MAQYPSVELIVNIGSVSVFGAALPDTGYDGAVIIPVRSAEEVFAPADLVAMQMADGHPVEVDSWEGELDIEGHTFDVQVRAFGDIFIIGREVLDQLEICFVFGREVQLRFAG